MRLLENALLFFLVSNPIGNSPAILALVKHVDLQRQKFILFREGVIALLLALFFQYFGEFFLGLLGTEKYTLTISGGILLLIVALSMLFSSHGESKETKVKQEPFIVPIATPLIAGPGVMTFIMIRSSEVNNSFEITCSLLIAFTGIILVMTMAPYLQKLLGKKGLDALEQVMGMVIAFIAVEMLVKGFQAYISSFNTL